MQPCNIVYFFSLCIFAYSIIIDADKRCDCSEVTNSNDCNEIFNCRWVKNQCEEHIQECSIDIANNTQTICNDGCMYICDWDESSSKYIGNKYVCSQETDSYNCNRMKPHCYWNNKNNCDQFTQCSDYAPDNCPIFDEMCNLLNSTCVSGWPSCSTHTTETQCFGRQTTDQECLWGTDKQCKSVSIQDCSSLTGFVNCDITKAECTKDNTGQCRSITCSDKLKETECLTARIVQSGRNQYYLCRWTGSHCLEATTTDQLTSSTCSQYTAANYKWTAANKCEKCSTLRPVYLDSQKNGIVDYKNNQKKVIYIVDLSYSMKITSFLLILVHFGYL